MWEPLEEGVEAEVIAPASPQPWEGEDLPIGLHTHEYLCGTAGTGKTTLAKALLHRAKPGTVALCATTGIAAVNLGEGTTINALLGYFNLQSLRDSYTHGHLQGRLKRLQKAGLTRILLDEVSMLSGQQLTILVRALEEVNHPRSLEDVGAEGDEEELAASALAPIGLTVIGDFGQLPPVPDKDDQNRVIPVQFAFESGEWDKFAPHVTTLTTVHRQEAQEFVHALHAVRKGDAAAVGAFFSEDRFSSLLDDRFNGTTIFAKNEEVDRYNQLRLDDLKTPYREHHTMREGKQRGDWKLIPDVTVAKDGALVMLLSNRRVYEDAADTRGQIVYANGDLGRFDGVDRWGQWLVTLQRNNQQVQVLPVSRANTIPLEVGRRKELIALYGRSRLEEFITEDGKYEIVGHVYYMPLRVAYRGGTVHKTQGLSLDHVQINIRDPFFKQPGMLFVALSRCRTAEGLRIVGNREGLLDRCRVNAKVAVWL